ncbi:MAG: hypothetical protein ACRDQA_22770 [Nocardioidaceae bacterium]
MTEFKEPRTEIEWSRRAIINVVNVLSVHAYSLSLVGAHAVLLRTAKLDVPRMPTGDGDLGVTPGLVGDVPSIEALLADAGYDTAQPPAPACGVASPTTTSPESGPSARRSTSWHRTVCQARRAGLSVAFRCCNPATGSWPWATPWASSWRRSTGPA